jgi:hypothetical protein
MKVAFATCSAMEEGWVDDHHAARLLDAEFQVWDDTAVDWSAYDRGCCARFGITAGASRSSCGGAGG